MKELLKNQLFIGGIIAIIGFIIAFAFGGWNGYWNDVTPTTIVGVVILHIGVVLALLSQIKGR